ncbi:hypothetical protein, conserved [Eimeria brunetti]|uniref:Uncharacterized protein n=1 Tax=Eimeria brunetti TaxID=51314 RepID=U6M2F2_9EIME|nr:hypothetical protein, conserved [Eimeria brunetti]
MGNTASADDKPKRVAPKDLQCHTYIKTYREGDAELPEDPDFPKRLLDQTRSFDFSNQAGNGHGTYIFYPNKDKPKMWVGQYKCLNPDDLLCNQGCPLDASTAAKCGEAATECIDPVGLMQYCMPRYPEQNAGTTELPGGTAYATASSTNEDQMRIEQAQVNSMAQQAYAMATGNAYAHSNFDQRLAFYQELHRSNLPCTPVVSRTYQGTEQPNNAPYQL